MTAITGKDWETTIDVKADTSGVEESIESIIPGEKIINLVPTNT
jgi:hypothetical protein